MDPRRFGLVLDRQVAQSRAGEAGAGLDCLARTLLDRIEPPGVDELIGGSSGVIVGVISIHR